MYVDIDIDGFLSGCSKHDIEDIIESLIADGWLPAKSAKPSGTYSDWSNEISCTDSDWSKTLTCLSEPWRLTTEELNTIKSIASKYEYLV